ncbi:MAG: serine/threonine-protein kinase [Isosphaeraceae bacterium]
MASIPPGERTWIDEAADRFEKQWQDGPVRPLIEHFLDEAPADRRAHLLEELLRVELELRRAAGERPAVDEYLVRFPDDDAAVASAFGLDRKAEAGHPASAAENMLFGLLALQNNFIDRDALMAAFSAWVADKGRPLGRVLLDRKLISPGRYAALELLVQEHIAQHGSDPERSLAMLKVGPEVRERLGRVADLDFQCSLMTVDDATAYDTPDPEDDRRTADAESTADYEGRAEPADPEGRFQLIRFHDAGNLGDVFLARDSQLHRVVALKRIKPRPAKDADNRTRFVVEAEITGRLEHPCIVPVYSLGKFDDGRPFYTMRFIRGDNLKRATRRFHEEVEAGLDPGARTLALQKLLRRFLDVCNAIAYAHSRGVVHRDLKPGNIMLGQYGETLVVDWGLAKSVGRADRDREAAAGSLDRTIAPESGSDVRPERTGDRIGTPAYMSPEQAAGRIGELGPRSDVYALGATLYTVLTGKAPYDLEGDGPFNERAFIELLRKVERGEFDPPRKVRPWVDPALEAICLKAMKLRADERYATPRALADDVEHWLADEPVGAYREPRSVRLKRWMRKHPSRVTGVAAAGLVTILGLAMGGLVLREKNLALAEETLRANQNASEAERRQREADEYFRMARGAVDEYFVKVTHRDTSTTSGWLKRQDLLDSALGALRGACCQAGG